MVTTRTVTISAAGNLTGGGTADYTDLPGLFTAEAVIGSDLVAADQELVVHVDSVDGAITISDLIVFDTFTTDATHRITIRPRPGAAKHDGTDNGGAKFIYNSGTTGHVLDIGCAFTFEDMIFEIGGTLNFTRMFNIGGPAVHGIVQRSVLIHSTNKPGNRLVQPNMSYSSSSFILRRNIIYNKATETDRAIFVNNVGAGANLKIYGNTIYGPWGTAGIDGNSKPGQYGNNLVNNTGTGASFANMASATSLGGNRSDDATSPDVAGQSKTFSFVNAASYDFHLDGADAGAQGAGVVISGDDTDIDDAAVPGSAIDAGADQIIGASGGSGAVVVAMGGIFL